jgi:hypothetical protein
MQNQTTNNQKQIQKQYGPHKKKNSVRTIVLWNFPDNNQVCPKWNFPAQDIQAILFIPSQLFIHREDI